MNITYLGPAGATFSVLAYDKLAAHYGAPRTTDNGVELSVAKSNEEVLPLMLKYGGFGAIAMETKAEGRVDPPINSFIELLRSFDNNCPINVVGALCMKLQFALMAHNGVLIHQIQTVTGHAKALGACRNNLKCLGARLVEASSNGQAAEEVSLAEPRLNLACLGPRQAAQKYGLNVLIDGFEDREAITTFFLLGPHGHKAIPTYLERNLTVFRVKHVPGALVKVLTPFSEEGINLRLIHSLHLENGVYDFAIETESASNAKGAHQRAIAKAEQYMDRWIQFGPFPVTLE